jgi:hypothetical protein
VHRLLRDEGVHGGGEGAVLDPVAEAADGLDEEALALGEEHRERVPERGQVRVTAVPVARDDRRIEAELEVSDDDHDASNGASRKRIA